MKKPHHKPFGAKGLLVLFMLHLIKVLLPSSKFPPEIKHLTFMKPLKEQERVTFTLSLKTSYPCHLIKLPVIKDALAIVETNSAVNTT